MWVKATDKFTELDLHPFELGFAPEEGHIFEVTEDRFETLSGNNRYNVKFVEPVIKKKNNKPKKDNKIGIIIPNCNYSEWLEKCLGSILNQTYTNYQIIFVDDCSTDDSVEKAKKILGKPHKVVELKQKRFNGGARNEGYLYLDKNVDYVWYVDSDDWLPNERVLENINLKLQKAPDVLFIGMDFCKNNYTTMYTRPNYSDKYEALQGWSGSCGKVIRKELATKQECLYNEGTLKEDKNHHYKVCIYMQSFMCYPKSCYVWNRDNKKSITTKRSKYKWKPDTLRHWADALELSLSVRGMDSKIDSLFDERLKLIEEEIRNGGDRQF